MSKKERYIVVGSVFIVVVIMAIVGAWLLESRPTPGGTITVPVEKTTVVRYDGIAFKPESIKVKSGTKVFFINESTQQRPMYIASDDHPTHQNYQGFDAAAVNDKFPALNESFDFVFDKKGTWGYHDHNFPAALGKIIVE